VDLLKSTHFASQDFLAKKTTVKNGRQVSVPSLNESHRVIFIGSDKKTSRKAMPGQVLRGFIEDWQAAHIEEKPVQNWQTKEGTVWLLNLAALDRESDTTQHQGLLKPSDYGRARDLAGAWLRNNKIVGAIEFYFNQAKDEVVLGAIVGLGLASYKFLDAVKAKPVDRQWAFFNQGKNINPDIYKKAVAIFTSMNLARHLSNLPAGLANPENLANAVQTFFRGRAKLKVKIYDVAALKREKMGLLLGVGQGSATGARFVHLQYRGQAAGRGATKKNTVKAQPLAFVGKGVTFDTGGLDLKNAAGMRWMKKDMSGAATVAGLCHLVTTLKLKQACDFYLPLAENAVSSNATRPGDVHVSRAGHLVEIDNTDAEGRLVMADAIDFAVTRKGADKPEAIIDVSTLTGAMRVALGLDVAGFFANDDRYAKNIEKAAVQAGELAWRMPLIKKHFKQLSSPYGDFKNSSDSGFGGAITAALFLEKFVQGTPWVHFDVMSWNNSGEGAVSDGANAQCVQTLALYLLARG